MWDLLGGEGAPSIAVRKDAFEALSTWTVPTHVAVSPCLKLVDPRGFADWIARFAEYATVDTFTSGGGVGWTVRPNDGLWTACSNGAIGHLPVHQAVGEKWWVTVEGVRHLESDDIIALSAGSVLDWLFSSARQ